MSTQTATVDYILDQLASLRTISARKMFGEYALYCEGKVVGLVCDDALFIKNTEEGRRFAVGKFQEGEAYPGAKTSLKISEDDLEDREWISRLVNITAENVSAPKKKKKK